MKADGLTTANMSASLEHCIARTLHDLKLPRINGEVIWYVPAVTRLQAAADPNRMPAAVDRQRDHQAVRALRDAENAAAQSRLCCAAPNSILCRSLEFLIYSFQTAALKPTVGTSSEQRRGIERQAFCEDSCNQSDPACGSGLDGGISYADAQFIHAQQSESVLLAIAAMPPQNPTICCAVGALTASHQVQPAGFSASSVGQLGWPRSRPRILSQIVSAIEKSRPRGECSAIIAAAGIST